jgi:hypothetical protein
MRPGATAAWSTVVGVADDIHLPGLHDDLREMQVYTLIKPTFPEVPVLVRTSGSGEAQAALIRRTIGSVNRAFFVRQAIAGESYLRESLAPTRFAMALLMAFAGVALVLSAVGLYGVIAYSVTQRTREIGIRIALGAEPRGIARLVLGEGIWHVGVGLLAGAGLAWAGTRLVAGMLYGVAAADPLTIAVAVIVVVGAALLASYVPGRRAANIDPTTALRAD